MEALAAHAIFAAGIGAVAVLEIIGFVAVHGIDWYCRYDIKSLASI
jgi:hypothetical protein